MDIVCGTCGVEDALYECISCNKKFCIDDWDKIHSEIPHPKLSIKFLVNQESKAILINFFEKLKSEASIIFKLDKDQLEEALEGKKHYKIMPSKYPIINSSLNAIIFYIMKTKFVTKKFIYNPIDYFLINSQVLAEKYIRHFNLSQFQEDSISEIQDFLIYNYLKYESQSIYSKDVRSSHEFNLWSILPQILVSYIMDHKYKHALEFLENLKGLFMFHKWFYLKINDTISIIQTFITQILHQNYNIDLTLWRKTETKVNKHRFYGEAHIFYLAFQSIFYNLTNRKYFIRCSKCILKITKTTSQVIDKRYTMHNIYRLIIEFYARENNDNKIEKYKLKILHLYEKKGQLTIFNSCAKYCIFGILFELIGIYSYTGQLSKKKLCSDKLLHFSKIFKPTRHFDLIYILYYRGEFFF